MDRSRGILKLLSRQALPYWGVFSAALLARLVHFSFMRANDPFFDNLLEGGDSYGFYLWAMEIAQTRWLEPERVPFFQGPLYPYFLGLAFLCFGLGHATAAAVQHVVGAGTVVLIYELARRVFGGRAALIAALLAAFCPVFLLYEGEILADSLSLFLSCAALLAFLGATERPTLARWVVAGVLVGLCVIGRPNMLVFLPAAVAGCWWLTRGEARQWQYVVLVLVGALAPMAPVTLTNCVAGGEPVLVTANGPVNLYIGNAPDATGVFARPPSMIALTREAGGADRDVDWTAALLRALREESSALPRNLVRKSWLFVQGGEIPHNVSFHIKRGFSPLMRTPLTFGILAPLGLVGLIVALGRKREERRFIVILAVALLLHMASIVLVFVLSRFRLPALAILIVFAGYLVDEGLRLVREAISGEERGRAVGLMTCFVLVVFVLGWSLRPRDTRALVRWNDYYNLAGAYEWKGRYADAVRAYEEALRLKPDDPTLGKHIEEKRAQAESQM
jgi:dolichyl-phosphate-mannose-protein mannosyltransferase/tetratricopeptide repeat protein